MRLPFLQVAMEVVEVSAPELAVALDLPEPEAGWGLLKVMTWALARCREDRPPSADAVVEGPNAAKLIARAAGYQGDPVAYVEACAGLRYATLEVVAGGIRVKGLDRYDAAWRKNSPERSRVWDAAHLPQVRLQPVAEPERNRSGSVSEPAPQTQTQTQTQTQKKPPPPTSSANADGGARLTEEEVGEVDECWEAFQAMRVRRGLTKERGRPKGFEDWLLGALREFDQGELGNAFGEYLDDMTFRAKGHPTAVFITDGVWRIRTRTPRPTGRDALTGVRLAP